MKPENFMFQTQDCGKCLETLGLNGAPRWALLSVQHPSLHTKNVNRSQDMTNLKMIDLGTPPPPPKQSTGVRQTKPLDNLLIHFGGS